MADDQKAPSPGSTVVDGSVKNVNATGAHATLPNAPSWFSALAGQPVSSLALVGVLTLSGVQVSELFGKDPAPDPQKEIEAGISRQKLAEENRALLEQAAKCSDDLAALAKELRDRDDDKFAFMSEIVLYTQRAIAALLGDKAPDPGDRLQEYTRKGTLRGIRDH